MVGDYLRLQELYAVDWAGDVQEARGRLSDSAQYDIVLLDYRLPDGTGLDILDEIQQCDLRLPVIMITGQGDERIAAHTIQRGAADYLVKGSNYLPGLPAMMQKVIRDHELRQEVDRSLEKIRYQSLLLDNVRDAVIVWDDLGQITFWNPAAEALFGWPASERLGLNVKDIYYPMFSPRPDPDNHLDEEVERRVSVEGGGEVWVSSRITSLQDNAQDGKLIGYMDVLRDITERRKMEGLIQAMTAQMTQSARLSAIGELASGVAHRISNPLVTVIANAQILKRELGIDHPDYEASEDIEKAGWQAQQVVKQLLEFSRPAVGTAVDVSVNSTIESALVLVEPQIREAGVELILNLGQGLPPVWGVARQIEDLWVNLLLLGRDAALAGEGSHHIWLRSTRRGEQSVQVEVADDGVPIPADKLSQVFEPNFISSSIGRGTGLELSICREIVRQHHGQIRAASNGRYNMFAVNLPASKGG